MLLVACWEPPLAAGVKLNADGCWYESSGKAGFEASFGIIKGSGFGGTIMENGIARQAWAFY